MGTVGKWAILGGASALLLLATACGGSPGTRGAENASCVGPYLNDQPPTGAFRGPVPTVRPGDTITVYGHRYTTTCNDTGGDDPQEPLPPVRLTVTLPGGVAQPLGEFTPAGDDLGFSTMVDVPANTPAGTATVRDDLQHTYTFSVGD
jgi:hypothetical protein